MKKILLLSLFSLTVSYSSAASAAFVCGCWHPTNPANPTNPGANPGRNYCDYSNAASNNGWGWNAATGEACAPQNSQGYCDYTGAEGNGGWGWNPVTKASCR